MNESVRLQPELRLFSNLETQSATIFFEAPHDYHGKHAGIQVFDDSGSLVWQAKEPIVPGLNKTVWNAADVGGRAASSGQYWIRVLLGRRILQQGFSLVK